MRDCCAEILRSLFGASLAPTILPLQPPGGRLFAHLERKSWHPKRVPNGILYFEKGRSLFQEFSQRYAQSNELGQIELPDLRRQDAKNPQNSTDDLDPFVKQKLEAQMITLFSSAQSLYNQMIDEGVAKECARMVLPLCTPTKIYMTGSCRSWIHYIDLRSAHGTQKEHMDIAEACRKVFTEQFPTVSEALEWE